MADSSEMKRDGRTRLAEAKGFLVREVDPLFFRDVRKAKTDEGKESKEAHAEGKQGAVFSHLDTDLKRYCNQIAERYEVFLIERDRERDRLGKGRLVINFQEHMLPAREHLKRMFSNHRRKCQEIVTKMHDDAKEYLRLNEAEIERSGVGAIEFYAGLEKILSGSALQKQQENFQKQLDEFEKTCLERDEKATPPVALPKIGTMTPGVSMELEKIVNELRAKRKVIAGRLLLPEKFEPYCEHMHGFAGETGSFGYTDDEGDYHLPEGTFRRPFNRIDTLKGWLANPYYTKDGLSPAETLRAEKFRIIVNSKEEIILRNLKDKEAEGQADFTVRLLENCRKQGMNRIIDFSGIKNTETATIFAVKAMAAGFRVRVKDSMACKCSEKYGKRFGELWKINGENIKLLDSYSDKVVKAHQTAAVTVSADSGGPGAAPAAPVAGPAPAAHR